jgi:hypothetical protein
MAFALELRWNSSGRLQLAFLRLERAAIAFMPAWPAGLDQELAAAGLSLPIATAADLLGEDRAHPLPVMIEFNGNGFVEAIWSARHRSVV